MSTSLLDLSTEFAGRRAGRRSCAAVGAVVVLR
jgi:hypothetical protein